MNKQEMLDELHAARAELLEAIEGLSEDAMSRPGAADNWCVKDILAHITAWESELVTALNQAQGRAVPNIIKIEDIEGWNEEQYHVNAGRPLRSVLDDFEGVHKMLVKMVEDYREQDLTDVRRYPWMEGEPLTYLVQENASLHELEHAEDIRKWREGQPPD